MAGMLAVVSTLASGLASFAGAQAQSSALKQQAKIEEIRARGEELKGRELAVNELEKANDQLAANNVAAGFSGQTPSNSASAKASQNEFFEDIEFQVAGTRQAGQVNRSIRQSSANAKRAEASAVSTGGIFSLVKAGFSAGATAFRRG